MAKTSAGWSTASAVWTGRADTLCAVCRELIKPGEPVVDNHIYKCGELDSIELAHAFCVRQAGGPLTTATPTGEPPTGTSFWLRKGDQEAEFLRKDGDSTMIRVTTPERALGWVPRVVAIGVWKDRIRKGYAPSGRTAWCACCCN